MRLLEDIAEECEILRAQGDEKKPYDYGEECDYKAYIDNKP